MYVILEFGNSFCELIRPNSISAAIHIFDLMPGATRQAEPIVYQTKSVVQQIAVSRGGNQDDQYLIFIDANRDIFCATLKSDANFEIYKIGEAVM